MKLSLASASVFVLIALLTLLSFKPSAQSNSTSKKNDSTAIPPLDVELGSRSTGEGVRFYRAILDSLLRYEDCKTIAISRTQQIRTYQAQLTGCEASRITIRADANTIAEKYHRLDTYTQALRRRHRRAQIERWAWRVTAAAIIARAITLQ